MLKSYNRNVTEMSVQSQTSTQKQAEMLQNTEISKIFAVEAREPMICDKSHKFIGSASMRLAL